MPRALLVVVTGCVVVAATAFITAYTTLVALTDETWPEL